MAASNISNLAATVREEDLQELEDLRRDLQGRADKALTDGRIFMAQEYITFVAVISPKIKRIRDRFDREALASFRKQHKGLKESAKSDQQAS